MAYKGAMDGGHTVISSKPEVPATPDRSGGLRLIDAVIAAGYDPLGWVGPDEWDAIAAQLTPDRSGGLDTAWAAAESVLPENWAIYLRPAVIGPTWVAEGRWRGLWYMVNGPLPSIEAGGLTPADALTNLVTALTEATPDA